MLLLSQIVTFLFVIVHFWFIIAIFIFKEDGDLCFCFKQYCIFFWLST